MNLMACSPLPPIPYSLETYGTYKTDLLNINCLSVRPTHERRLSPRSSVWLHLHLSTVALRVQCTATQKNTNRKNKKKQIEKTFSPVWNLMLQSETKTTKVIGGNVFLTCLFAFSFMHCVELSGPPYLPNDSITQMCFSHRRIEGEHFD